MKRILLLLVMPMLTVSLMSQDDMPLASLQQLSVSNVTLEGPRKAQFSHKLSFTLTNTGDTEVTGTLYIGDEVTMGDYTTDRFTTMFNVNLAPKESTEISGCFLPWRYDAGKSYVRVMGIIADDPDQNVYDIYREEIDVTENKAPNRNVNITLQDSYVADVSTPRVLTIPNTGEVVFDWEYENLEDSPLFSLVCPKLGTCIVHGNSYIMNSGGSIWYDNNLFTEIGSHEKKTGQNHFHLPQTKMASIICYCISLEYLYQWVGGTSPSIGTEPYVLFKVEDTTGIEDIGSDEKGFPIYTISGMEVVNTDNLPKGIYIRNGKKFVVK